MSNAYEQLLAIKGSAVIGLKTSNARIALCPDMGGRIFAELQGQSLHRVDLDCVRNPVRSFNNFGGGNVWPAPEGGKFGFNYRGETWFVQDAINVQPFEVLHRHQTGATIQKSVELVNRLGTRIAAVMRRELEILPAPLAMLEHLSAVPFLSYRTIDSFHLPEPVAMNEGLIAAWTLDQFDATEDTMSFCVVGEPQSAINFDFYDPPHDRIRYARHGFVYKTDGGRKGQIGIRQQANASCIGFRDLSRRLLCVRQNASAGSGIYFNIADNDQSQGPFSASDNYSIFNSDPDMQAFELETVGSARIEQGRVVGSELVSVTTFMCFPHQSDVPNPVE